MLSRPLPVGRRILLLPLLLLLATCADDNGTGPGSVVPSAFRLEGPTTAGEGVPFEVQVTALGADGSTTLTSYSGAVTLSASGGTVTPSTVTLTSGTATAQVNLTGASGSLTLSVRAGEAEGSVGNR